MDFTQFLIVCPLVFLAGFVDAIAGGGGLIALPAYVLAGLPMHSAIATNKMSSVIGTVVSTLRFFRGNFINIPLMFPSIICALIGAWVGAKIVLQVGEEPLKYLLLLVLPIVAYFVLKNKSYENRKPLSVKAACIISVIISFFIGAYDGFYGPGAGTFLILMFYNFARMDIKNAAGNAKIINLSSNFAAFAAFLMSGKVLFTLGLVAAMFSVAGHWMGAGVAIKGGYHIIRPIILVVLALLFIKILV